MALKLSTILFLQFALLLVVSYAEDSDQQSKDEAKVFEKCLPKNYATVVKTCPLQIKPYQDAMKSCWKSKKLTPLCTIERIADNKNYDDCPDEEEDENEKKKADTYVKDYANACYYKCVAEEMKMTDDKGKVARDKVIEAVRTNIKAFGDEKWKDQLKKEINECYDEVKKGESNSTEALTDCKDAEIYLFCTEETIQDNMFECMKKECDKLVK